MRKKKKKDNLYIFCLELLIFIYTQKKPRVTMFAHTDLANRKFDLNEIIFHYFNEIKIE